MIETRIAATCGMVLALASIVLGPQFWGYEAGVLILQAGVMILGVGLFWRISLEPKIESMFLLDDIE